VTERNDYPPPARPRVHCWVDCNRVADGVVSITRIPSSPVSYQVANPDTGMTIFRGPWRDAVAFAAGELAAPFMNEPRTH
jgi:hypothetical protein